MVLDRFKAAVEEYRRIVQTGWSSDEISTEKVNPVHVVNNIWSRVIALLSGWDYTNSRRRLISVDELGRVFVTSGGVGGITANISQVAVGTTATLVKPATPGRSYLIIKNAGLNTVYLGESDAVSSSTGYALSSGEVLELRDWSSALYGISVIGSSTLMVIER
jgi:hypothetical protein